MGFDIKVKFSLKFYSQPSLKPFRLPIRSSSSS